jgi:type IV secretion system protein VirB6
MELLGNFFFQLMSRYIDNKFYDLSTTVSGPLAGIFVAAGTAALTVYLVMIGIRISTGDSRESMSSIIFRVAKMVALFAVLSASIGGAPYFQSEIMGIRNQVLGVFGGGSGETVYINIDQNLDKMAQKMALIDSVHVGSDVGIADAKSRALTMGLFGQTTPPLVAGMLVLINELGMRIAIMLSPIFIAAFMFKKTEGMFFEWIKFIISSTLSLGVLSMVISIMGDLTAKFFLVIETLRTVADMGLNDMPQLQESVMIASFGMVMTGMLCSVPLVVNRIMGAGLDYSGAHTQGMAMGGGGGRGKQSSSNTNSYAGNGNSPGRVSSGGGDSGASNSTSNNASVSNYNNSGAQPYSGGSGGSGHGAVGLRSPQNNSLQT